MTPSSMVTCPASMPVAADVAVSCRQWGNKEVGKNQSRRVVDLPAKRRRQSTRKIDMPVPAKIFWIPDDKSTHHLNYPSMLVSDYNYYSECAELNGERFIAGQPIFDMVLRHHKPERGSLPTPSEPTIDSRTTSNVTEPGNPQTSNRIFAKITATPKSCLPTITFDLIYSVTSWGRGHYATIRYTNSQEIRIPKYAFKIFLFKPGYYTEHGSSGKCTQIWKDEDQDMTFYISSKASAGIWINGVKLPSFKRQDPCTPSKFWGELRHNDLITAWSNSQKRTEFTQFQFECFWGMSSQASTKGEQFMLIEDIELLDEIDRTCLAQENRILGMLNAGAGRAGLKRKTC